MEMEDIHLKDNSSNMIKPLKHVVGHTFGLGMFFEYEKVLFSSSSFLYALQGDNLKFIKIFETMQHALKINILYLYNRNRNPISVVAGLWGLTQ